MKEAKEILKDHNEFFQSIDRIKIAGNLSIKANDEESFYYALNELNSLLSHSLYLLIDNLEKYQALFNTDWVLNTRYDIDYSELQSQPIKEFKSKNFKIVLPKRRKLVPQKSVHYGFFTFAKAYSELKGVAIASNKFEMAKATNESVIEIITNVVSKEFNNSKNCPFQNELRVLIDHLIYDETGLIQNDMKISVLKTQEVYGWYFQSIYKSDFHFKGDILAIFDDQLFLSIRKVLNEEDSLVWGAYVSKLIDGLIFPAFQLPFKFLERKSWGKEEDRSRLDDQLHRLYRSFDNTYFLHERNNLEDKVIEFIDVLKKDVPPSEINELNDLQNSLLSKLNKNFLYHHIKLNSIQLLAYALFQKKFEFIKTILDYNQPIGNVISYYNKDILPVDFRNIIDLIVRKNSFQNRFYYFWDGHNDNTPYLDHVLLLLLARSYFLSDNNLEFPDHLFSSQEEKSLVKNFLEKLLKLKIDEILKHEMYAAFNNEFIEVFKTDLFEQSRKLTQDLKEEWLSKDISSRKVEEFRHEIIEGLSNKASMWNLFKAYDLIYDAEGNSEFEYVGINEIGQKGYFVEPSDNYYVNWAGGYTKLISEYLENYLWRNLYLDVDYKFCKQSELLDHLDEINLKGKLIIAKNYRISFKTFRDNSDFKFRTPSEDNPLDTGYVGEYKEAKVFEIYNQISHSENIMIIDRADLGEIHQSSPEREWMSQDFIVDKAFFRVKWVGAEIKLMDELMKGSFPELRILGEIERKEKLLDSVQIMFYRRLKAVPPKTLPTVFRIENA